MCSYKNKNNRTLCIVGCYLKVTNCANEFSHVKCYLFTLQNDLIANCIIHNVKCIMHAYKKHTLDLVGCHFPWKASTNILNELFLQNSMFIVKYVNCIIPNA